MAIRVSIINGEGASTYSSGTITNTGVRAVDLMATETDLIASAGVVNLTTDFLTTQRGAGANMSVDVTVGTCLVLNASWAANNTTINKYWRVINDATVNATIAAADGSNPRIDLVCVKVNTSATPNDYADNVATIISSGADATLKGTAAGSPVAPAVPSNYYCIAQILVGTGVTSIVNANITDRRTQIALITNSVTAPTLATNAILLGQIAKTDNFTTTATPTITDITGASLTVTIPAGGRNLLLYGRAGTFSSSAAAGTFVTLYIRESTTTLNSVYKQVFTNGDGGLQLFAYVAAPGAGSHTYVLSASQGAAGTLTVGASSTIITQLIAILV